MTDFVHLHLHSEYSLLDGACRIEELLDRALQLQMPALAITEHGNMFSSIIFHDQARKRGINPILGCEVYVAPGDRRTKSGTPGETANHLVLLAATNEGYHNLIKLVSSGYTEGFYYKPRIDKELLAQHATGLIGLSSCLKGEVATGIRTEQQQKAINAAAAYRDILGPENFFLEMQYQGIDEQRVVNVGLQPIARDLGLPLVVTNDVHYLQNSDFKPHDILLCIGTGKGVNDTERLRYHGDQFYLKTAEEMATVFQDYPEALANTVRIAERCHVDLSSTANYLPNFDVPAGFTLEEYFEKVVRDGFEQRLPRLQELAARGALEHTIDEYERRLSYEVEMIKQMKYPGYFLIVWDFIRYARERGIPVGPGRGSAAGSFVAYCLRITDVDPIAYDLIFERFLNPERVSLPDIDIDFCERRRGEVIDYVTRKYGRENVAQIITFGTMKARAVVRDVARVMDIPYADADKVAKAIPPALDMTLAKALEESPTLKEMVQKDERVRELIAVAQRLEGMTRHASVHAAGVVIAPKPLTEFVPLYKSPKDEIVTQWAMKEVERVGLLKMDFLGLSTLTLIRDALDEIKRTDDIDLDIDAIPLNDQKTYKLFCDGQTYGVFQFESSGMRELLRKAKPERLDDLIALNALYRPGPLKSGMVDDFIARKQGRTEVKYELAALAPILSDTYGVIAYQEQVMRIAAVLAGFSMGQSDVLRKAMGKKDPKVMAKQREAFTAGARAKGVNEKKATKIFDLMEFFAGYGFNKSHSTTYAWIAYQTAYLKANYPRHFMAALLTIEAANTDKLAMYLRGVPRSRGSDPAPGHQLERAGVHRRPRRRPLRPLRHQERRRGRDPLDDRRQEGAGPDSISLHALRARGSPPGEQARPREPDQVRRPRFAGWDWRHAGGRQGSALHRRRQGHRARWTPSARSRQGTEPVVRRFARGWPGRTGAVARRTGLAREPAARVREGSPRPVHERASTRALRRRDEDVRRAKGWRARRVGSGYLGRRHRLRTAAVEDQEGRPHGRLHAGRRGGSGRSRGLPRDVRKARLAHRGRRDAARARQVRKRR